jgi:hypothetical protein
MDFDEEPVDDDNDYSSVFPNYILDDCSFSSRGEEVGSVRVINHGNSDFEHFVQLIIPDPPSPESTDIDLAKKMPFPRRSSSKASVSRIFKLKR